MTATTLKPFIFSLVIALMSAAPTEALADKKIETSSSTKKEETSPPLESKKTEDSKSEKATTEKNLEEKKTETKESGPSSHFDISKGFSEIAEPALKAVVNVSTTSVIEPTEEQEPFPFPQNSPFDKLFSDFFNNHGHVEKSRRVVLALGSGFVIKADNKSAIIVTNFHVIAQAKKITVTLHDGTELEATELASDDRTDVALLQVNLEKLPEGSRKLTVLEWGDSNKAKVGHWVLAIGNPFGLGSTVTSGIISNRARNIMGRARTRVSEFVDDFIQHDASLNLGNSGGPILNMDGQVIGINTAIFTTSGGSIGIGFAVPSNLAKDTIKQLLEFGRPMRGWLGVKIQHVDDAMAESIGLGKARGAIVGSVTPEGPGAKGGIEPGDVILEFDGKEIKENTRLTRVVAETSAGKEVKVKVWRKGKEVAVTVTVGENPSASKTASESSTTSKVKKTPGGSIEYEGLKLSPLTPDVKDRYGVTKDAKGILIIGVASDSLAAETGLRQGDIIVEVNQKEVAQPEEFISAFEDSKKSGRQNILLMVTRNGEPRYLALRIIDDLKEDNKDGNKKTDTPETKGPGKKKAETAKN